MTGKPALSMARDTPLKGGLVPIPHGDGSESSKAASKSARPVPSAAKGIEWRWAVSRALPLTNGKTPETERSRPCHPVAPQPSKQAPPVRPLPFVIGSPNALRIWLLILHNQRQERLESLVSNVQIAMGRD